MKEYLSGRQSVDSVVLSDEEQALEMLRLDWARNYLLRPEFELAASADIEIPRCVDTADEAVVLLKPH